MTEADLIDGGTRLAVRPLCPDGISFDLDSSERSYDLTICTVGYERRSTFLADRLDIDPSLTMAFAYDVQNEGSFEANWRFFMNRRVAPEIVDARTLSKAVRERVRALGGSRRVPRIALDISVLDRTRLAGILLALLDADIGCEVDFLYAPARFVEPALPEPPLLVRDPVHERFAGWSDAPDLPISLIVGLGHETEKAVGAVEFLEPAKTWVFVPQGISPEHDGWVASCNKALWFVHPPSGSFEYDVMDPFGVFQMMESLLYGMKQSYRPVVVPFGPKVFALVALLASLVHAPSVAVWRVSSGHLQPAVDREADGRCTGLRVKIGPRSA